MTIIDAYLDDMSDDALAEIADSMQREAARLSQMSGKARHMLGARHPGATKIDTEHWTGTILAGAWEIVDDRALRADPDVLARCFVIPQPRPPVGHWDNRALNEMHKLGGVIATIIDASRRRGEGTLVLERKKEAEHAQSG